MKDNLGRKYDKARKAEEEKVALKDEVQLLQLALNTSREEEAHANGEVATLKLQMETTMTIAHVERENLISERDGARHAVVDLVELRWDASAKCNTGNPDATGDNPWCEPR
ncbi:hypothetical protein Dimus_036454, partial [Dionaea muscipula]